MKLFLLLLIGLNLNLNADTVSYKEAPTEWLITQTLQSKLSEHGEHSHELTEDDLINEIFNNTEYNEDTDELTIITDKKENNLRSKLLNYLTTNDKKQSRVQDPNYIQWKSEKTSANKVILYLIKTKRKQKGFYFFNHIHTKLSKDNPKLKKLKYSASKIFKVIENFLKYRKTHGVVALTDHGTDKAFNEAGPLSNETLTPLRSVEWGGKTHMNLIDLKKDWDLLGKGKEFSGTESIIQSRSSESFRVVNHPNKKKPPFHHKDWMDVDGVEVWNSILENSPFLFLKSKKIDNRGAFAQWVDSLKNGKRYTAVAGSDFHFVIPCLRDRGMMYPNNFIPAEDKGLTKKYLKEGRVSILTRPDSPKLELQAIQSNGNKKIVSAMGSNLKVNGNVTIHLKGDFSDSNKRLTGFCYNTVRRFFRIITFWKKRRWEVRFYNKKNEVVAKRAINPRNYGSFRHFRAEVNLNITGEDLIRAEVWEINKKSQTVDLVAITNPIYFNYN